jgi:LysR family transcriptional regulator, regulator for genes of the gallate degradation pathway
LTIPNRPGCYKIWLYTRISTCPKAARLPDTEPFEFPNLRHLRAFREVARFRGVSAASDAVALSQPAITQAISRLETRLGVSLFKRLSSGMVLTDPGSLFVARIGRMLDQLELGVSEAQNRQGNRQAKGFARFERLLTAAQLRALIALAEARNFSIAARNTGLSQPSIHRAARDLERLAGFRMFRVSPQGISLTEPAQLLARRVRLAAAELQQGLYEIKAWKGQDSTRITIGAMPLARTRILPRASHAILKQCPGIQLRTIEGPYAELLRGLRFGEIDFLIGALRDPVPAPDVMQEPLLTDRLAVVSRADHPLAQRQNLKISDTLDYPWIAPPKVSPTGQYLCSVLNIDALPETPVRLVTSSLILLRGMLLEGEYLTILSRHQIRHELDQGLLVALPVTLKGSKRPIGLTFRADWQPTATQELLLDHLRQEAKESQELSVN